MGVSTIMDAEPAHFDNIGYLVWEDGNGKINKLINA